MVIINPQLSSIASRYNWYS